MGEFMKKTYFLILLSSTMLLLSCNKDSSINNPQSLLGKLVITSNPSSAKIFISDVDTKKVTPDSVDLEQGNHGVTLKLTGYFDTTFTVEVLYNFTTTKNIVMSSALGKVFVNSFPAGAQIFIAGNNTGKYTPDTIYNLVPGTYDFLLRKSPYPDTTVLVNVHAGILEQINVNLIKIPASNVSYSQHIQPLFNLNCNTSGCHDDASRAGNISLTTCANTTADPSIVFPGEPDNSRLVWAVEGIGNFPMPPPGYPQLTSNQISGIRTWISEGAECN